MEVHLLTSAIFAAWTILPLHALENNCGNTTCLDGEYCCTSGSTSYCSSLLVTFCSSANSRTYIKAAEISGIVGVSAVCIIFCSVGCLLCLSCCKRSQGTDAQLKNVTISMTTTSVQQPDTTGFIQPWHRLALSQDQHPHSRLNYSPSRLRLERSVRYPSPTLPHLPDWNQRISFVEACSDSSPQTELRVQ